MKAAIEMEINIIIVTQGYFTPGFSMCFMFFWKQYDCYERRSRYFETSLARGWELEFNSDLMNCESCF